MVFVTGPAFALLISFLLRPIWDDCLKIGRSRWFLFLLPALAIAAIITWRFFSIPETQHQLEIIPHASGSVNEIQVQEIKAAYGNVVPLSNYNKLNGWALRNGLLIAT